MPSDTTGYGSIGSISYDGGNVNIRGVAFDDVVRGRPEYSVSEATSDVDDMPKAMQLPKGESDVADVTSNISAKAKPHFNKARRKLYGRLGEVFNVPKFADRKYLEQIMLPSCGSKRVSLSKNSRRYCGRL